MTSTWPQPYLFIFLLCVDAALIAVKANLPSIYEFVKELPDIGRYYFLISL